MGDKMISRQEKNKVYVDEINKEKTRHVLKLFLKIISLLLIVFTIIFLYSYFIEIKLFKTNEYLIKDSSIPKGFNGTKILHLTDILYGKTISKNELNKIQEEITKINPDIVIFTGNIVSHDYSLTEDEIKYLNDFFKQIPYQIGKYAIKGDSDTSSFDLILDNTDFTIINNEKLDLYNEQNEKINLVGINHDEESEIKLDDNYTIIIINNYDELDSLNINGNLVFSGHNLGGEMRLFNIPLLGMDKNLNNYYEKENTKIYISNGLGSIHHLRFMNRPSMNVYRLYN